MKVLFKSNTEVIIITRHWNILSNEQLEYFSFQNVCINTSVSALDNEAMLNKSLNQYERIKPFCKSVLRIVSCNFNLENEVGNRLNKVQKILFSNESTLDTVFRPSKNNKFVTDGIIKVKEEVFNGKKCLASKMNRKTYMGKCNNCKEMCGVNIESSFNYINKRPLTNQLVLL